MKKLLLTSAILLTAFTLKAQTKKLPSKVTITLTDKEVLRIDSAIQSTAARIDSKQQTESFIRAFIPIYAVIEKQLIPADTTKKK